MAPVRTRRVGAASVQMKPQQRSLDGWPDAVGALFVDRARQHWDMGRSDQVRPAHNVLDTGRETNRVSYTRETHVHDGAGCISNPTEDRCHDVRVVRLNRCDETRGVINGAVAGIGLHEPPRGSAAMVAARVSAP